MRAWLKIAFLTTFLAVSVQADPPPVTVKIGARDAALHYNESLTVTGRVAQVTLRPTIVFINLDQPYPDSPFAAIIHSQATNQFPDLRGLRGKAVEISGKVVKYHDRPEIVLEKASQLVVPGGSGSPLPAAVPPVGATPKVPAALKAGAGTNDLTNGIL